MTLQTATTTGRFHAQSLLLERATHTRAFGRRRVARGEGSPVAEWLSGDGLLIFDDEPEKAYSAKVIDGIGIEQIAVTGHCSVTFLCEPFAESIGYNQKAVQSVSLPDTVTINVKGTQETDGLIYITARGTITNLTVTRLKVN